MKSWREVGPKRKGNSAYSNDIADSQILSEGPAPLRGVQAQGSPADEEATEKANGETEEMNDMLSWQYRQLIAELQQVQLHASDPTCPCVLADTGEYCLPKHCLSVASLAAETAAMDSSQAEMLNDLSVEATEMHQKVKAGVCGHGKDTDLVSWSRAWRKKVEAIYYACKVAHKGKMKQESPTCTLALPMSQKVVEPVVSITGSCGTDVSSCTFTIRRKGRPHLVTKEVKTAKTVSCKAANVDELVKQSRALLEKNTCKLRREPKGSLAASTKETSSYLAHFRRAPTPLEVISQGQGPVDESSVIQAKTKTDALKTAKNIATQNGWWFIELFSPAEALKYYPDLMKVTPVRCRLFQEPTVRIAGTCTSSGCSLKVKGAIEKVEASDVPGLPDAIGTVIRHLAKREAGRASPLTFAPGISTTNRYEFEFKIVEATDLIVSHDPFTFELNPKYTAKIQPRIRERIANQLQVKKIAARLDPEKLLMDTKAIDTGSPIVGPDNLVECGNGRVMALVLAAKEHPSNIVLYRLALKEVAVGYGLPVAPIDKMKLPVLVRLRLTSVDRQAFAEECNARPTIEASAIEKAHTDADKITPAMLTGLEVLEGEPIERALRSGRNKPFVTAFLSKLPENEQALLIDAHGVLNVDGVRRMGMAIFVATFKGNVGLRLAEKFFEAIDDTNVKNAFNGILRSLALMAQAESLIASGQREAGLAFGEDLAKTITVFSNIRAADMSVADYINQMQLLQRELSPFQERVLKVLDEHSRSAKRIGGILSGYAQLVIDSPPPGQSALMPGVRPSKEYLFETAVKRVAEEAEAERGEREARKRTKEPVVAEMSQEPIWCTGIKKTKQDIDSLSRRVTGMRDKLAKAKTNLETPLNICAGQREMFVQHEPTCNLAELSAPRPMTKAEWAEVLKYQLPLMPSELPKVVTVTPPCPPVCLPTPLPTKPVPEVKHKYELFDFQKEGVAWLKGRSFALLADEMGLGKTPQAIHWGADSRPVLVIVPASLTFNWRREITEMWRPQDTLIILDGKQELPPKLPDWTVVSYSMLNHYLPKLQRAGFQAVIIDEAHWVKNLDTQRTQNVLELIIPKGIAVLEGLRARRVDIAQRIKQGQLTSWQAKEWQQELAKIDVSITQYEEWIEAENLKPIPNRLAVTGTPIVNRPIELFPLLVFLGVKSRGDFREFLERYTQHHYVKGRMVFTGARNLYELHQSLKPFMIRRMKKDVLKQLPPKVNTPMFVPISNAAEYIEAERNFLSWLRDKAGNEAAMRAASAEIIVKMNSLRMLSAMGKVQPVCDWLKPCRDGQGKVLVFCSFVQPLDSLQRCKAGESVLYTGQLSAEERQAMVDHFQRSSGVCYFLGTVGAAGVGITLTAASRVCFLDLPWTPGGKIQAEDRAHRIGQTRSVEIVNVLARGTIDERMLEILREKEFIIAQAVDGKTRDEAASGSIASSLIESYIKAPVMVEQVCQYEQDKAEPDTEMVTEDDLQILQGFNQGHEWLASKLTPCNLSEDELQRALSWKPLRDIIATAIGAGAKAEICTVGMVAGIYQLTLDNLTINAEDKIIDLVMKTTRIRQVHTPVAGQRVFEVRLPIETEPSALDWRPQKVIEHRGERGEQPALFKAKPQEPVCSLKQGDKEMEKVTVSQDPLLASIATQLCTLGACFGADGAKEPWQMTREELTRPDFTKAPLTTVGYRYGKAPIGGKSFNTMTNKFESGTSMASAGGLPEIQSFATAGAFKRGRFYYEGDIIGYGGDDEPIMAYPRMISVAQYQRSLKSEPNQAAALSLAVDKWRRAETLAGKGYEGFSEIALERKQAVTQLHRARIKQALSEGKPVPPEVLADYPDLAKTVKVANPLPVCTKPQAKKLESCTLKVKARNVEHGCKPEGTGSKECPNPFAVCRASIGCRFGPGKKGTLPAGVH